MHLHTRIDRHVSARLPHEAVEILRREPGRLADRDRSPISERTLCRGYPEPLHESRTRHNARLVAHLEPPRQPEPSEAHAKVGGQELRVVAAEHVDVKAFLRDDGVVCGRIPLIEGEPRRVRAPGTPRARKKHEGAPVALQGLQRGAARGVDRIERGEHDGAAALQQLWVADDVRHQPRVVRDARFRKEVHLRVEGHLLVYVVVLVGRIPQQHAVLVDHQGGGRSPTAVVGAVHGALRVGDGSDVPRDLRRIEPSARHVEIPPAHTLCDHLARHLAVYGLPHREVSGLAEPEDPQFRLYAVDAAVCAQIELVEEEFPVLMEGCDWHLRADRHGRCAHLVARLCADHVECVRREEVGDVVSSAVRAAERAHAVAHKDDVLPEAPLHVARQVLLHLERGALEEAVVGNPQVVGAWAQDFRLGVRIRRIFPQHLAVPPLLPAAEPLAGRLREIHVPGGELRVVVARYVHPHDALRQPGALQLVDKEREVALHVRPPDERVVGYPRPAALRHRPVEEVAGVHLMPVYGLPVHKFPHLVGMLCGILGICVKAYGKHELRSRCRPHREPHRLRRALRVEAVLRPVAECLRRPAEADIQGLDVYARLRHLLARIEDLAGPGPATLEEDRRDFPPVHEQPRQAVAPHDLRDVIRLPRQVRVERRLVLHLGGTVRRRHPPRELLPAFLRRNEILNAPVLPAALAALARDHDRWHDVGPALPVRAEVAAELALPYAGGGVGEILHLRPSGSATVKLREVGEAAVPLAPEPQEADGVQRIVRRARHEGEGLQLRVLRERQRLPRTDGNVSPAVRLLYPESAHTVSLLHRHGTLCPVLPLDDESLRPIREVRPPVDPPWNRELAFRVDVVPPRGDRKGGGRKNREIQRNGTSLHLHPSHYRTVTTMPSMRDAPISSADPSPA